MPVPQIPTNSEQPQGVSPRRNLIGTLRFKNPKDFWEYARHRHFPILAADTVDLESETVTHYMQVGECGRLCEPLHGSSRAQRTYKT